MITKAQRKQMLDYVSHSLEHEGLSVRPRTKELLRNSGIETSYVLVGENQGIVLLVDQVYPNQAFDRIYSGVKLDIPDVGVLFFNDGKTFFRNAAEKNFFKQSHDLSLKNYSQEDMQKMMLLRPEERSMVGQRNWLQYYQPGSDQLEESVESFKFVPIEFDYSHIDSSSRFKPQDKTSERLSLWRERAHFPGKVVLDQGYIKERV